MKLFKNLKNKKYYKLQSESLSEINKKLENQKLELIKENAELEECNKNLQTKIKNQSGMLSALSKRADRYQHDNDELREKIITQGRKNNSSKGGYIKQINKLKEEKKELEEKLVESMSDKYLVKKIPSGRKPKSQSIRVKSSAKQSTIVKNLHKEAVSNENN